MFAFLPTVFFTYFEGRKFRNWRYTVKFLRFDETNSQRSAKLQIYGANKISPIWQIVILSRVLVAAKLNYPVLKFPLFVFGNFSFFRLILPFPESLFEKRTIVNKHISLKNKQINSILCRRNMQEQKLTKKRNM